MELWRKRLSDVTSSFERASRREPPQGDEPPALRDMIASTSGADNVPDGESLRSQVGNRLWQQPRAWQFHILQCID